MPIDIKQLNQSELSGFISGNLGATYRSVLGNNVVYTDETNQIISGFKTFRNPPNVPYAGTTGQVPSLRYTNDRVNLASGTLNTKIDAVSGQNFFFFRGDFISGNIYNPHDAVYYNGGTYGYTGITTFNSATGTPVSGLWHALAASGFGTSGYSGYGFSGYSGYSRSGYSGYSGSGDSGYSGFSSLSGYSGYSGGNGSSGYSGFSGANPGESGYSGYSGSGVSGYSGFSGDGLSGYSGYSGSTGGGTVYQVTGTNFTTTNTTGNGDVITGLSHATSANKVYEIDVCLKVQSDTSAGCRFTIDHTGAGYTGQCLAFGTLAGGTVVTAGVTLGSEIGTTFMTLANFDGTIWLKAILTTVANAGNIRVSTRKITSGTVTVYIGSRMTITEIA